MENKPLDLEIVGLMQGKNMPLEQVQKEICPECAYKTPICKSMMKWHIDELSSRGCTFVCKGMRHWTTESN
jgi:hypothetical protein